MASLQQPAKFSFPALIVNLLIPMGVGALGGALTQESVKTWYLTINKPAFTPPNWAFPTVWTTLFVLIGIAAYRVWQKRQTVEHVPRVAAIYAMQLLLNLMWSFLFFYAHQIDAAFFEILVLLAMIAINGYVFFRIDKIAGLLFIPYFLWVSYATVLTYTIMRMN